MPYTTVDDLRLALNPGGVQDPATASNLSDDELEDAIGEAQARVDSRLRNRYTVPFPDGQVPPIVVQLTRDVAAYFATLTHRRSQPVAENHPVALRYGEAVKLLDSLADGKSEAVALTRDDVAVVNPYDDELFLPADFDLGPVPDRSVTNRGWW